MAEEVKKRRTRRPKVTIDVKVSPIDFEKLKAYADSIKSKPEAILEELVKEYLDREEVKKVLEDKGELIKLKEERSKKQNEIDEIDRRIEELEGSQK